MKIQVRVKTRASNNKVIKNPDGIYTACVTAPPVKGEANKLLIELLSKEFGVNKSSVRIIKGERSRTKIIFIGE